jgi:hypothetical protein
MAPGASADLEAVLGEYYSCKRRWKSIDLKEICKNLTEREGDM